MGRGRRGFGQLRQLPSGRWQAVYVGPDAKLHKAPRTYSSEHDAEAIRLRCNIIRSTSMGERDARTTGDERRVQIVKDLTRTEGLAAPAC
jgi:hypothetical protein